MLSRKTKWPKGQPTLCVGPGYGKPHSTKFGGHRDCSIEDAMDLVFHVILLDHGVKQSSDSIGRRILG